MIEFVKETVREAGELLLKGYEGDRGIRNIPRGSDKLVTEYDLESERLIVSRLNSRWKGYNIVSEEELSAKKGSEFTWLIDPLDGTSSFIKRSPFFSISVALVRGREIVLGVVYAPALGEMYEVVKGGGTLVNGKSAEVSVTAALANSLIFFSRGSDRQGWRSTAVLDALVPRVAEWKKLGSAALEACWVACGEGDGCVLNAINPWDIAAGALMVEEAGGQVTDFYGEPWKGGKEFLVLSNGLLQPELVNLTKNALRPGRQRF